MNYIRHLTGFYEKIHNDDRLNPTHISLYLALFQFWNLNHFKNPISISRNEMMRSSKIGALGTYHKCIKQLQEFGYIEYIPSFNPYKGSLVNLYNFEHSDAQNLHKKQFKRRTTIEQPVNNHHIKNKTTVEQEVLPSKNSTNTLNNKNEIRIKKNNSEKLNDADTEKSEEEKFREKTKVDIFQSSDIFKPPTLPEIKMYFEEKDNSREEAERFFNHYESNGWLVGGKSKMKNWQAAARNWLLNSKKFNSVIASGAKQSHLNAATNKSYQDKL